MFSDPVAKEILGALSAERVRRTVETITENIPTRLAGSENGRRMAEFTARVLTEVGAAGRVVNLPGLVSFPGEGRLKLDGEIFTGSTLGQSAPSIPGGTAGRLVDVGPGDARALAEAARRLGQEDLTGCLLLSDLASHPPRQEKLRLAQAAGAVGCVMMNFGPDDGTAIPFGSVKAAWGNPEAGNYAAEVPSIPAIGLSRRDGTALRVQLASNAPEGRIEAEVENDWREIQITLGEIASGQASEFVLVGGHQDSWFGPQATDNAAGTACILEIARVFAPHSDRLLRGLVFGCWQGHETGTMIGSSWIADQEWDRLSRGAVAYLQIDEPGCVGTTRWDVSSNAELRAFHEEIEDELLDGRARIWRKAAKMGDASFLGLGIPMIAAQGGFTDEEIAKAGSRGWWHHSVHNTIDKLDWDEVALHLRLYAGYLWRLCTVPILPYRFAPAAAALTEAIDTLPDAPMGIDTRRLGQAAWHLAGLLGRVDARLAAVGKSAAVADNRAAKINDLVRHIARELVPLSTTVAGRYGQDPYGYSPLAAPIPAIAGLAELEAIAEGEPRLLALTRLRRARNRVADAVSEAAFFAELLLGELD